MKKRMLTLMMAALLAGCSNGNIDPDKVRTGLAGLDDGQKAQLEQALSAIQAGKYGDAVTPLKKIAFSAKLNKDQIALLKDTMAKVEAKAAQGR